jgi:outer membrane protein assembly factor BamB
MKKTQWIVGAAVLFALGSVAAWQWGGIAAAQTTKAKATKKVAAAKATKVSLSNPAAEEAKRGDWSRWRGVNNDGISLETGLLTEWPEGGPPLAWRTKGLGGGYASVAVADGKIYTLGKRGGGTWLHARSTQDGSEIWSTEVGGGGDPNGTPTVDGDLVFGLTLGGDLFCCKTADGALVWSKNYKKDFGVAGTPSWGFSESPLVDGDRLICTPGNNDSVLACLDKRTGDVIWKTQVQPGQLMGRGHEGAAIRRW